MDRLINTVQDYTWGSVDALPALLGTDPTGRPQAELWMGAHPVAPSRLDRGAAPSLLDVIEADPRAELGEATLQRHGVRLPSSSSSLPQPNRFPCKFIPTGPRPWRGTPGRRPRVSR